MATAKPAPPCSAFDSARLRRIQRYGPGGGILLASGVSNETSISVNFGKPLPLFPLDRVSLLPQQVLQLHVFEPRYRQMVEQALDGAGQIGMAVFRGDAWKQQYHGRPPIRAAVCIGQIVQHQKLDDGRFNLLLQGVCRARVIKELPASEERLYRMALLEPVGIEGAEGEELGELRDSLDLMLSEGPLTRMHAAGALLEYVRNEEIPTTALMELVSFTLLTDSEVRYKLLAEGDAGARASLIRSELVGLRSLLRRAEAQRPEEWPKGCSWN